ncbi:unnamed protein product [Caenorhabditis angaria]|uniref:Uncharacterized protein n=1 Tax=Caenorhabditis angaria TaxID=860376 RepID=A0A9P1ISW3_9PELO|nr:unnamed protein product [Caenorhabditis angaria]
MTFSEAMDEIDFDQNEACTSQTKEESGPCCLVCGRVANTGHHYGVTACLGCKTFFRRVVLQPNPPKCKNKNECAMEKNVNAKRLCRSCRYMKCKQVGMTEEALHPCRDVIGRRHPRHSVDSSPISSPPSLPPQLSINSRIALFCEHDYDVLQNICEMDTSIRTRTAHILGKPETSNDNEIHFYSPTCDYTNVSVNSGIGPSLKVDIILLKEWVEGVPCYLELSERYRNFLMRRFCLRYTVIEHGLFTAQMPPHKHIWFLSDRTFLVSDLVNIPDEIRKLLTPNLIMEQKLLAPFVAMLIQEVADPLRHLKPSSLEVAAVKTLMLMKPTCLFEVNGDDVATKEDGELVQKVRNKIISGLHAHYIKQGMNNEELAVRLGELLMLTGGVEICADRALEEMHLLRIFNLSSFDQYSSNVIFGFSREF